MPWACEACTFHNDDDVYHCIMCSTRKPLNPTQVEADVAADDAGGGISNADWVRLSDARAELFATEPQVFYQGGSDALQICIDHWGDERVTEFVGDCLEKAVKVVVESRLVCTSLADGSAQFVPALRLLLNPGKLLYASTLDPFHGGWDAVAEELREADVQRLVLGLPCLGGSTAQQGPAHEGEEQDAGAAADDAGPEAGESSEPAGDAAPSLDQHASDLESLLRLTTTLAERGLVEYGVVDAVTDRAIEVCGEDRRRSEAEGRERSARVSALVDTLQMLVRGEARQERVASLVLEAVERGLRMTKLQDRLSAARAAAATASAMVLRGGTGAVTPEKMAVWLGQGDYDLLTDLVSRRAHPQVLAEVRPIFEALGKGGMLRDPDARAILWRAATAHGAYHEAIAALVVALCDGAPAEDRILPLADMLGWALSNARESASAALRAASAPFQGSDAPGPSLACGAMAAVHCTGFTREEHRVATAVLDHFSRSRVMHSARLQCEVVLLASLCWFVAVYPVAAHGGARRGAPSLAAVVEASPLLQSAASDGSHAEAAEAPAAVGAGAALLRVARTHLRLWEALDETQQGLPPSSSTHAPQPALTLLGALLRAGGARVGERAVLVSRCAQWLRLAAGPREAQDSAEGGVGAGADVEGADAPLSAAADHGCGRPPASWVQWVGDLAVQEASRADWGALLDLAPQGRTERAETGDAAADSADGPPAAEDDNSGGDKPQSDVPPEAHTAQQAVDSALWSPAPGPWQRSTADTRAALLSGRSGLDTGASDGPEEPFARCPSSVRPPAPLDDKHWSGGLLGLALSDGVASDLPCPSFPEPSADDPPVADRILAAALERRAVAAAPAVHEVLSVVLEAQHSAHLHRWNGRKESSLAAVDLVSTAADELDAVCALPGLALSLCSESSGAMPALVTASHALVGAPSLDAAPRLSLAVGASVAAAARSVAQSAEEAAAAARTADALAGALGAGEEPTPGADPAATPSSGSAAAPRPWWLDPVDAPCEAAVGVATARLSRVVRLVEEGGGTLAADRVLAWWSAARRSALRPAFADQLTRLCAGRARHRHETAIERLFDTFTRAGAQAPLETAWDVPTWGLFRALFLAANEARGALRLTARGNGVSSVSDLGSVEGMAALWRVATLVRDPALNSDSSPAAAILRSAQSLLLDVHARCAGGMEALLSRAVALLDACVAHWRASAEPPQAVSLLAQQLLRILGAAAARRRWVAGAGDDAQGTAEEVKAEGAEDEEDEEDGSAPVTVAHRVQEGAQWLIHGGARSAPAPTPTAAEAGAQGSAHGPAGVSEWSGVCSAAFGDVLGDACDHWAGHACGGARDAPIAAPSSPRVALPRRAHRLRTRGPPLLVTVDVDMVQRYTEQYPLHGNATVGDVLARLRAVYGRRHGLRYTLTLRCGQQVLRDLSRPLYRVGGPHTLHLSAKCTFASGRMFRPLYEEAEEEARGPDDLAECAPPAQRLAALPRCHAALFDVMDAAPSRRVQRAAWRLVQRLPTSRALLQAMTDLRSLPWPEALTQTPSPYRAAYVLQCLNAFLAPPPPPGGDAAADVTAPAAAAAWTAEFQAAGGPGALFQLLQRVEAAEAGPRPPSRGPGAVADVVMAAARSCTRAARHILDAPPLPSGEGDSGVDEGGNDAGAVAHAASPGVRDTGCDPAALVRSLESLVHALVFRGRIRLRLGSGATAGDGVRVPHLSEWSDSFDVWASDLLVVLERLLVEQAALNEPAPLVRVLVRLLRWGRTQALRQRARDLLLRVCDQRSDALAACAAAMVASLRSMASAPALAGEAAPPDDWCTVEIGEGEDDHGSEGASSSSDESVPFEEEEEETDEDSLSTDSSSDSVGGGGAPVGNGSELSFNPLMMRPKRPRTRSKVSTNPFVGRLARRKSGGAHMADRRRSHRRRGLTTTSFGPHGARVAPAPGPAARPRAVRGVVAAWHGRSRDATRTGTARRGSRAPATTGTNANGVGPAAGGYGLEEFFDALERVVRQGADDLQPEALATLLAGRLHLQQGAVLTGFLRLLSTLLTLHPGPVARVAASMGLVRRLLGEVLFPAPVRGQELPVAEAEEHRCGEELLIQLLKRRGEGVEGVEGAVAWVEDFTSGLPPVEAWRREECSLRGRDAFVGLVNPKQTCYLNASLQQLFMAGPIRDAVLAARPGTVAAPLVEQAREHVAGVEEGLGRAKPPSQPLPEDVATADKEPEWVRWWRGQLGVEHPHSAEEGAQGNEGDAAEDEKKVEEEEEEEEEQEQGEAGSPPPSAPAPPALDSEPWQQFVLRELRRTFLMLQRGRGACYAPLMLLEACRCLQLNDDVYRMNDASEFLSKLMDVLDGAMRGSKQWERVRDHMLCREEKRIVRVGCAHESVKTDEFFQMTLPITKASTLQEALQEAMAPESMAGDNALLCEACGARYDATITHSLSRLPPLLVLGLKRFDVDSTTWMPHKVNKRVSFPTELDMAPFTMQGTAGSPAADGASGGSGAVDAAGAGAQAEGGGQGPRLPYRLCGVLVHRGAISSGHYWSYIRDPGDADRWWKFDDKRVVPYDASQLEDDAFGGDPAGGDSVLYGDALKGHGQSAFLLFYEWVGDGPVRVREGGGAEEEEGEDVTPLTPGIDDTEAEEDAEAEGANEGEDKEDEDEDCEEDEEDAALLGTTAHCAVSQSHITQLVHTALPVRVLEAAGAAAHSGAPAEMAMAQRASRTLLEFLFDAGMHCTVPSTSLPRWKRGVEAALCGPGGQAQWFLERLAGDRSGSWLRHALLEASCPHARELAAHAVSTALTHAAVAGADSLRALAAAYREALDPVGRLKALWEEERDAVDGWHPTFPGEHDAPPPAPVAALGVDGGLGLNNVERFSLNTSTSLHDMEMADMAAPPGPRFEWDKRSWGRPSPTPPAMESGPVGGSPGHGASGEAPVWTSETTPLEGGEDASLEQLESPGQAAQDARTHSDSEAAKGAEQEEDEGEEGAPLRAGGDAGEAEASGSVEGDAALEEGERSQQASALLAAVDAGRTALAAAQRSPCARVAELVAWLACHVAPRSMGSWAAIHGVLARCAAKSPDLAALWCAMDMPALLAVLQRLARGQWVSAEEEHGVTVSEEARQMARHLSPDTAALQGAMMALVRHALSSPRGSEGVADALPPRSAAAVQSADFVAQLALSGDTQESAAALVTSTCQHNAAMSRSLITRLVAAAAGTAEEGASQRIGQAFAALADLSDGLRHQRLMAMLDTRKHSASLARMFGDRVSDADHTITLSARRRHVFALCSVLVHACESASFFAAAAEVSTLWTQRAEAMLGQELGFVGAEVDLAREYTVQRFKALAPMARQRAAIMKWIRGGGGPEKAAAAGAGGSGGGAGRECVIVRGARPAWLNGRYVRETELREARPVYLRCVGPYAARVGVRYHLSTGMTWCLWLVDTGSQLPGRDAVLFVHTARYAPMDCPLSDWTAHVPAELESHSFEEERGASEGMSLTMESPPLPQRVPARRERLPSPEAVVPAAAGAAGEREELKTIGGDKDDGGDGGAGAHERGIRNLSQTPISGGSVYDCVAAGAAERRRVAGMGDGNEGEVESGGEAEGRHSDSLTEEEKGTGAEGEVHGLPHPAAARVAGAADAVVHPASADDGARQSDDGEEVVASGRLAPVPMHAVSQAESAGLGTDLLHVQVVHTGHGAGQGADSSQQGVGGVGALLTSGAGPAQAGDSAEQALLQRMTREEREGYEALGPDEKKIWRETLLAVGEDDVDTLL